METTVKRRGQKAREIVRLVKLAQRLQKHIWEANDDLAKVRLSNYDELAMQHEIALGVAKQQLSDLYHRIGFLMVEGENSL